MLGISAGIADNMLSVGAPRLEPHSLGLASLRGFAGSVVLGRS